MLSAKSHIKGAESLPPYTLRVSMFMAIGSFVSLIVCP